MVLPPNRLGLHTRRSVAKSNTEGPARGGASLANIPRMTRRLLLLVATTMTTGVLLPVFSHGQSSSARPPAVAKLSAESQAVLDQLAALGAKPLETLSPAQARSQPSPADAVKALLKKQGKSAAPEPVGTVVDTTAGSTAVRIYTPKGSGPFPLVLYVHGGGWVIATLDTYDASARAITNAAQAVVVSTHYRQAPEHKFPASHDDVYAAYKWALSNAKSINADPARVAVVGESAGGNMAFHVSIRARDEKVSMPAAQVLVYPVASGDMQSASYREHANAKPLSAAGMAWFFTHTLASEAQRQDPRITLTNGNLKGLPPTTIITADLDVLRSEGQQLAEALKASGVDVVSRNFAGVPHEFFGMAAVVPQAREAIALAGTRLKAALK